MPGRYKLLTEAVDRLEELDERVAIMSAETTEPEKDLAIIGECRIGKIKKYVGRGVVILNYEWWRELLLKTGFRIVPTEKDMEGAEHETRQGTPDLPDLR
jgi:hypothetical protein